MDRIYLLTIKIGEFEEEVKGYHDSIESIVNMINRRHQENFNVNQVIDNILQHGNHIFYKRTDRESYTFTIRAVEKLKI